MFAESMFVWLCIGALWLAVTATVLTTLYALWRRGKSGLRARALYALFLALACAPPAGLFLGTAGDDAPEAILPTPLLAFGLPFALVFTLALAVFSRRAFRGRPAEPDARD